MSSAFDDLEQDQLDALAELTGVLDIDAGVRVALDELDEVEGIDAVAGVLNIEAGTAAALTAAGLPIPDSPAVTERASPAVSDRRDSGGGQPEGGHQPARRHAIRRFDLSSIGANLLELFFRILERLCPPDSRRSFILETFVVGACVISVEPEHDEPPRSPTLDQVMREITSITRILSEISRLRNRWVGASRATRYQHPLDPACDDLAYVQRGLGRRSISLPDAVVRISRAQQAVAAVQRGDRRRRHPLSPTDGIIFGTGIMSGSTVISLMFFTTDPMGWILASTSLGFAVVAGTCFLFTLWAFQLRRLVRRRDRAELIESQVLSRISNLLHDVERLFDDADEFSGSGPRLGD